MLKRLPVLILAALPLAAGAATESFTMDPLHTSASFVIDHLGLSMIHGRFNKYSGKFSIDRAAKTGGVDFTIETASVDTNDNDKGNRPRSRDERWTRSRATDRRSTPWRVCTLGSIAGATCSVSSRLAS